MGWKDFLDFYRLIIGKNNRSFLIEQQKISRPTLSVRFKVFFASPLPPEVVWVLLPPKLFSSTREWVYG